MPILINLCKALLIGVTVFYRLQHRDFSVYLRLLHTVAFLNGELYTTLIALMTVFCPLVTVTAWTEELSPEPNFPMTLYLLLMSCRPLGS